MQAAGAEAKDQKNSSNQTKAQCRGTGAERKKAGSMHEEPLSEAEEREEKKANANQTGRFCHVASYSVLMFSPLLFSSLFFLLLFVFSPAHIRAVFTPYCPSLQSICAVLDLGRKRPFTHLGPAIQVPDNAPVSPE